MLTVSFFSPQSSFKGFVPPWGFDAQTSLRQATSHTSLCCVCGHDFTILHAVCSWYKTLPRWNGPRWKEWWHKRPGSIPLVLSYGSHTPLWFLWELRNCISQPNKLPCYFLSTLLLFSSLHFLFPYTLISTLGNFHLFFLNRQCQIFPSVWNPAQILVKGWINYSVSYARVNLYH